MIPFNGSGSFNPNNKALSEERNNLLDVSQTDSSAPQNKSIP
jgi:hypothetical protein